jgi:hypothetical protein
MTNLKNNISQKITKTIIGIVAIIGLLSTSAFAYDTVGVSSVDENAKSFKSQITLEEAKNQFEISFKNADAPVKITMMEMEDGIVYNTTTSSNLFSKYFSPDSLPAGEYTVLVEYKGQVVETKMFNIEETVQVTLMQDEEGIVFSKKGKMTNLNEQIKAQGLEAGSYTLLIETEEATETKTFEVKK